LNWKCEDFGNHKKRIQKYLQNSLFGMYIRVPLTIADLANQASQFPEMVN
jgi:hypothetical protein